MRPPPREPRPGERLSAAWAAALVRFVRASRPLPGPGMRARETPGGTFLSPSGGGAGAAPAAPAAPAAAWRVRSLAGATLTLAGCCYRRASGFRTLPDMAVALPEGESLVCAAVDLATGDCALEALQGAAAERAAGDLASGTARVPLYTARVSGGAAEIVEDWRGAPELLQYV